MLADDMRRLAEEISNAYEERMEGVVAMKAADAERKNATQADLREMANQLRTDLEIFKSNLEASEADRKSTTQEDLNEMAEQLRSALDQFKSDLDASEAERKTNDQEEIADRRDYITELKEKAQELLKEFDKAHEEMAKELRAFLNQFKSDLDAAEAERKTEDQAEIAERRDYITDLKEKAQELLKEFDKAHEGMARELRAFLNQFKSDLDAAEAERKTEDQAEIAERRDYITDLKEKAQELLVEFDKAHKETAVVFKAELSTNVAELLGEFNKDRSEAAEAWNEILSAIRSAEKKAVITAPVKVEAKKEVKTVEEAIEEEEPEEMEPGEQIAEEEESEEDDLGGEIVGILEDNPDGLRMVEIADVLGIESWRSLIPVMRELLDDDEVTKEDSTYYAV